MISYLLADISGLALHITSRLRGQDLPLSRLLGSLFAIFYSPIVRGRYIACPMMYERALRRCLKDARIKQRQPG